MLIHRWYCLVNNPVLMLGMLTFFCFVYQFILLPLSLFSKLNCSFCLLWYSYGYRLSPPPHPSISVIHFPKQWNKKRTINKDSDWVRDNKRFFLIYPLGKMFARRQTATSHFFVISWYSAAEHAIAGLVMHCLPTLDVQYMSAKTITWLKGTQVHWKDFDH